MDGRSNRCTGFVVTKHRAPVKHFLDIAPHALLPAAEVELNSNPGFIVADNRRYQMASAFEVMARAPGNSPAHPRIPIGIALSVANVVDGLRSKQRSKA